MDENRNTLDELVRSKRKS